MLIIKYIGHSAFFITDGQVSIATDPFGEIGYPYPEIQADYVTVSHNHYDHNAVRKVRGNPIIIDEGFVGEGLICESIKVSHDDKNGQLRGSSLIFKFKIGGFTICHMGDIGEAPSERILKFLSDSDILLMPVGGIYTIDAKTAKQYADKLRASIIPMHYNNEKCSVMLENLNNFTELFIEEQIERKECDVLALGDQELKKVIVLKSEV